ncbi:hypothetical protein C485_04280 [Natrinema altunense JCM 12890]|uniref:eCIS core domain-containing protein n=2 Tax=Natrinema altunense TaxID=222984 RepID=L9ZTJ8_NATA2|nr:hypothetical protein C485_04280 [Natrinema altunense JCM 12890]
MVHRSGIGLTRRRIEEGMPIEILGDFEEMEAFRERQNERPPEVPTDIERQNAKSVHRNTQKHSNTDSAGDTGVLQSVRDVISSSGRSLNPELQHLMEERMGEDFSDVTIHTGASAANACEELNARAFTVGTHITFNSGEYEPDSPDGQHLIAHELAHVRQQTGGALSMLPQDAALEIDPDDRLEREAEETAKRVVTGEDLGIQRMADTGVHIQRLNNQQVTHDSMEKWAAGFDINEYAHTYLEDETDLLEYDEDAGMHKITPNAGEKITRGLREEVAPLPTRDETDSVGDIRRNVAFAKIEIDGSSFWAAASSGKRRSNEDNENNPLLPGPFQDEREFDHRTDENLLAENMWDSEVKILEHTASSFDLEEADGRITLFTERAPCISCDRILSILGWEGGKAKVEEQFDGIETVVSNCENLEEDDD